MWPAGGACEAGARCPFCASREQLSHAREEGALLGMLRWYELGSGKRWSFRDLFSLLSYLLAGHRHESRTSERSEEHTSELQSLMRISYAVFCLKKKKHTKNRKIQRQT